MNADLLLDSPRAKVTVASCCRQFYFRFDTLRLCGLRFDRTRSITGWSSSSLNRFDFLSFVSELSSCSFHNSWSMRSRLITFDDYNGASKIEVDAWNEIDAPILQSRHSLFQISHMSLHSSRGAQHAMRSNFVEVSPWCLVDASSHLPLILKYSTLKIITKVEDQDDHTSGHHSHRLGLVYEFGKSQPFHRVFDWIESRSPFNVRL